MGCHTRNPVWPTLRLAKGSGFTLIEMVIALLVVAILTAIALPSYSDYLVRSRLTSGVGLLKSTRERLEQRYSDERSYALAGGGCAVANFLDKDSGFAISCTVSAAGQRFVLTATGAGPTANFQFSIDEAGIERTLAVRSGWSSALLPATRFITKKE